MRSLPLQTEGIEMPADYYDKAPLVRRLSSITIPTLVITAQDDPFIPYPMFADPDLHSNPFIQLEACSWGPLRVFSTAP